MQRSSLIPSEFTPPEILSGLDTNEPVLVGLSGGSDSVSLLYILNEYSKKSGAKIYAAHLNHGIRGKEADRDELFCKDFCAKLNVEYFSKKVDIPKIAEISKESVETVARIERYNFFDSVMCEHNIKILATAHNADNNLETVIFNLTRGAGLSGLCGIPESRPLKNGIVIRPILRMEKRNILKYCEMHGLKFVTDSTNAIDEYTRNKIRNNVIPILKEINSGVVSNVSRTTRSLKEDSVCLQSIAEELIGNCECNTSIELKKLCSAPDAIINRVLLKIFESISEGKTLEAVHIKAIKDLMQKGIPHSSISLPSEINVIIENKSLCFVKKEEKENHSEEFCVKLSSGENFISEANAIISIDSELYSKNIYKKATLLSIDSAKIEGDLVARSRCSGDRILSGEIHKSIKKLMCDKKIPIDIRSRIPIICDEKGILAVPFVAVRDGVSFKKGSEKEKNIKIYLL